MTQIPQTDAVEEMARFWDTHDITDFEDELLEIAETVFDREDRIVVQVSLDHKEADALHRIAQSRGMTDTDVLKEWVSEKLDAS